MRGQWRFLLPSVSIIVSGLFGPVHPESGARCLLIQVVQNFLPILTVVAGLY